MAIDKKAAYRFISPKILATFISYIMLYTINIDGWLPSGYYRAPTPDFTQSQYRKILTGGVMIFGVVSAADAARLDDR